MEQGGISSKKMLNDYNRDYLLQCMELLLFHLHNARRDVVAAESLPELEPSERLAVLN